MDDEALNPSVTGRTRSGPRHWYILALQIALTVLLAVYLSITAIGVPVTLHDLLTGVILVVVALVGVVSYFALFQDTVYVNRIDADWRPRWWRYFIAGFLVTFAAYALVRSTALAPILTLTALSFVAAAVDAVYLYYRHQSVGTP